MKILGREDFFQNGDAEIVRISIFPWDVGEGILFVALDGYHHTAREYLRQAIENGAQFILCDCDTEQRIKGKIIKVKNAKETALILAKKMYQETIENLKLIFITGTKGKSTTAHILASILNSVNEKCALVGTLGVKYDGYEFQLKNTTPDIFTLLWQMEKVYQRGAKWCALEVSSQALKDHRIDLLRGEYAIFTGLGDDHIDIEEHESFSSYRDAKRRLFCEFGVRVSIAPRLSPLAPFMTSGVEKELFVDTKAPSDLTLRPIEMSKSFILFTDGNHVGRLSLGGEYNLINASLALLCASEITGLAPHLFYPALSKIEVDGRQNRYRFFGREVWIDYAHNGDSIEALAKHLRPFCRGKMIGVIGAVGNRARGRRRPLSIACETCFDLTILTEDDSISERAEDITRELYSYFKDKSKAIVCPRRELAILSAYRKSNVGDMILLLGKGHEQTLLREGKTIPFSERRILSDIARSEYGKV